jgi:hypothetical protein
MGSWKVALTRAATIQLWGFSLYIFSCYPELAKDLLPVKPART